MEDFIRPRLDDGGDNSPPPIKPPTNEGGNNNDNTGNNTNSNNSEFGESGAFNGQPGTNSSANVDRDSINVNKYSNVTNPRMSYFKQDPQTMSFSQGRDLMEDLTRLNNGLEEIPPSFYEGYSYLATKNSSSMSRSFRSNNIDFTHSVGNVHYSEDDCFFRLGSFISSIPPEFIQISTTTSSDSINPLRSTGPTQIKHGYVQKEITVSLFMNTIDGINGEKINSAFGYPHYINGLRHLLGMFRYTPFVPVENTFLNEVNNIYNVGLCNIRVSTVEGFPNTLEVILTLKEFLTAPYLGIGEKLFDDTIIWPLFDFYIQRNIRDKEVGFGLIKNGNFNSNLKFYILKRDVLSVSGNDDVDDSGDGNSNKAHYTEDKNGKLVIDMLNINNYKEMINLNSINAKVTGITLSSTNTMPSIQMSAHDSPTFQYLGGNATQFSIRIETTDDEVVSLFDSLLKESVRLVRAFAYKTGVGFIKIENELFDLLGIKFVLINDIVASTVPGFPDLRTIEIQGFGYDIGQKDREKFKSFRPFYDEDDEKKDGWFVGRKGTRADLIMQNKRGHANKILQDSAAEAKLMTTEMYPDLRLPKYSAVDWALSKIKEFNTLYGLSNDGIPDKMPRPKAMIPGKGEVEAEYNGFVDPDFYVSYFIRMSHIDNIGLSQRSSEFKKENDERFDKHMKSISTNKQKSVRSGNDIDIGEGVEQLSSMVLNPIYGPHEPIEPTYVPGYEPDMQIRLHNGIINEGKSPDEMMIEKLNGWLQVSGSSGSANGVFDSVGENFAHAFEGQPGNNTTLPTQVKKVTGNPMIDLMINRAAVECGYLFGASHRGEICTEKRIQEEYKKYGGKFVNVKNTRKWIGRLVWDCSSFVVYAMRHIGIDIPRINSAHFSEEKYPKIFENITRDEAQVGDIFFNGGHVCVYCGDGVVVHARGAAYGCVLNKHNYKEGKNTKCGRTSRIKNLKEICDKFLQENPNFYINSSSDSTSTSNEQISRAKTTTETTVDHSNVKLGTFPNEQVKIGKYSYSPAAVNKWDYLILKNALKYNLDPNMIKAIVMIESSGKASLYNKICCYGLMQVYAKVHNVSPSSMLDPDKNLDKGCSIFAEYGKYNYINYDKKWWLASYNAGPGRVKQIQSGQKSMPTETVNYIKKFDVFYSILLKNGGNPGNTLKPIGSVEGYEGNLSNSSVSVSFKDDSKKDYVSLNHSKLKNNGAGTVHKATFRGIDYSKFGVEQAGVTVRASGGSSTSKKTRIKEDDLLISKASKTTSSDIDTAPTLDDLGIAMIDSLKDKEFDVDVNEIAQMDAFSNKEQILERMFVDMKSYNLKGRLAKAFPSYMFLIIDEHDNWIDNRKFWSNYYLYNSVLSIDVHSSYSTPVSTARVSLTNVYKNIREFKPKITVSDMVLGDDGKVDLFGGKNDSEYGFFNQMSYLWFGSIPFEMITDELLEIRNNLYEEIYIREGTRIHIRLGYGSNPANYARVFSGHIYEILDDGDVITIGAQSDGVELVSNVLTDRTSATNNDLGLPEECGDIVAALLCNRENEFMYSLSGGEAFKDNTYGINHFGLYMQGGGNGWLPYSWHGLESYSKQSLMEIGKGALIGGATTFLATGFNPIGAVVGSVVGGVLITPFYHETLIRRKKYEYDLVKNIYKATYDGEYMYDPQFLGMDGEANFRFFCYDRTPWDVFKMCEKTMTGFVCYPRPFGFEHRMFFGLPQWQCKYRYERKDSTNEVFEFAKSFAQVNIATSMYDIIDNRMSVSSKGHVTNMIGVYSLGGDLASTPVIMSDYTIDRSKQKTATIDTTATQNFKGLPNFMDKALEWGGFYDNGKHQAIKICLSELIDSWLNVYKGEVILLGSPDVSVHNYFYINDTYTDTIGVTKVKDVIHSFNGYSGYTTTVYPGLLASDTLDLNGFINNLTGIISVGSMVASYSVVHYKVNKELNQLNTMLKTCDKFNEGKKYIKTKGKYIVDSVKKNELYVKATQLIDDAIRWLMGKLPPNASGKIIKSVQALKNVTIFGVHGAVFAGKMVVGAVAFAAAVLLNKVLVDIYDFFRYRKCIKVFPLYKRGQPFIAGATGQKNLIPDKAKELAGRQMGEDNYTTSNTEGGTSWESE